MWVYIKIFLQYLFFIALLEAALAVVYFIFGGVLPMFEIISGTMVFAVPMILIGFMVLVSAHKRQWRKIDEEETVPTGAFVAQMLFEVLVAAAVAIGVGIGTAFLIN